MPHQCTATVRTSPETGTSIQMLLSLKHTVMIDQIILLKTHIACIKFIFSANIYSIRLLQEKILAVDVHWWEIWSCGCDETLKCDKRTIGTGHTLQRQTDVKVEIVM